MTHSLDLVADGYHSGTVRLAHASFIPPLRTDPRL